MQSFQWSAQMLQQQQQQNSSTSTSSSSGPSHSPASRSNYQQLSTPMTPQHQPTGAYDFGTLGPLASFPFGFAQPLPSINSFGSFPDFRHHPLFSHGAGGGANGMGGPAEDRKPFELASAVPRFDFSHPKRQMTNPTFASPTYHDHPHSPASQASQSSSSGESQQSRSPSASPQPLQSVLATPQVAPPQTYASPDSFFTQHLAYPPPLPPLPAPNPHAYAYPYSTSQQLSPTLVKTEGSASSSALDMLAVAAGTSAHPSAAGLSSSVATLTLEELQRRHLEQQEKITAGLKRQAEEAEEAKRKKKRIGRGLDPGKTRMLIFPPTLPLRDRVPKEEDEYVLRSVPSENLYTPRYTKGKDSRTRVAFCEYCSEQNLPTRMSGYGYHLLHTHNLSSHPPFLMPAPVQVRTIATTQVPDVVIMDKNEACSKPSPSLEGECPWKGADGQGRCGLTGWHKLNGWREAMNAHLGGKGLLREGK